MKKIIVISDVHGRKTWQDIIKKEKNIDTLVFLGDYLDSFDIPGTQQIENFEDIIDFKIVNPDKVILLLGNHCLHYIDGFGEHYSGFQKGLQYQYARMFEQYKNLFQMCYQINDILFTHAGISEVWYEEQCKKYELEKEHVCNNINYLWNTTFSPFRFNGIDDYGDDITQGPVWIRPRSLYVSRLPGFTHIVGHTTVKHINHPKEESQFYLTDSPSSGEYLEILLQDDNTYTINIKSL